MEIGWRTPPRVSDKLAHAAFVDAHPAVHPVDLAAVLRGKRQQGDDLILGRGVVFFGDVLAVHRIRMWHLLGESQARGALVGEYPDVMPSLRHGAEDAEGG